ALSDVPFIEEGLAGYLSHSALGDVLETAVPFVKADVSSYREKYQLADGELIPEVPYGRFLRFFSLPTGGQASLTEELSEVAQAAAHSDDARFQERARKTRNFLSVIKRGIADGVTNDSLPQETIGDTVYAAGPENVLALSALGKGQAAGLLEQ